MDDEARWAAVVARDEAADGAFVYGVLSTGVYCRPSCPSRQALRRNVAFFDAPAGAEAEGLRPCRRCDPTGPSASARRAEVVARACRIIDERPEPPTLEELAAEVGVSRHHLHRLFRAETGITPKAYAQARRTARVRARLEAGAAVTDAIYDAGYGSASRFYDGAPDRLGMTATAYRAGAPGVAIRVTVAPSSLGWVLVATTAVGVCAVHLGDDPDELLAAFRARFHAAEVEEGDGDLDELAARVVALVEDPATGAELPLDVRGTAFQERVWQALRAIPAGTTTTYSELAAELGLPAGARAVAAACAANRIAVAVPCHRVVRADGALAGYRWGLERKAALLAREAAAGAPDPAGDAAGDDDGASGDGPS